MIHKGDLVWLLKADKERHIGLRMGARGQVVGVRKDNEELVYLVKFERASRPRHTMMAEIMPHNVN